MVNTRKLVSIIAKVLLTIAIVLAVYAVAGFYIVPAVLEAKLPGMIEQQTGRKASVERIQFNPFSLVASLQNVKVQEKNGQPFAAFDHFHFDVNAIESIKQAALVVDDVRLEKPFVHIARQKSGDFNFSDLIKEEAEPKPEEEMFPATIGKLSVVEGKLAYEDASGRRPIKEQIFPIHLEIDNFSTLADKLFSLSLSLASSTGGQIDWQGRAGINPVVSEGRIKLDKIELQKILALGAKEKAPLEFKGDELLTATYQVDSLKDKGGFEIVLSLVMNTGEQLDWKGTINTEPMSSEGHIKLEKVTLDRIQRLALQDVPFNLKGEELLEVDYKASYADDSLKLAVSQGRFDIRGFQLSERDQDKVLVKLPSFSVRGIDLDLSRRQVGIDSVSADGADVQAWLNTDGVINYQALLAANKGKEAQTPNSTPQPAAAEETPWQLKVDNIALNNSALAFEDRTVKSPVAVKLSGINFKLNNFSNEAGASMPFQFDADVNNGTIALKGNMVNEPFSTRTSVDAKNIGLEPFQSYLEKFARLDIMDGKFNMNGKLSVALQEQKPPDIKFDGGSGIADLITRDQLTNKDFIKWKNLAFQDIKADVLAERYTAGALTIDKPYARVIIKKDKSMNFNEVMVADEKTETKTKPAKKEKPAKKAKSAKKAKPAKTKASADDSKKTYFKIDRIQVTDGSSDFADLSLILPFAARITDLNGGAGGFSSEKKSQVKVTLKGMAYDLAPVDIKGEVSPYQGDFDLEMNFRGMPMPLISPYMVEFAGYKVEKGKMTLGLKYTVDDNKLTASNSILIDQLVLGEKVENPDAVSLPLELAVALLKDSEGKIKIDVPITGSLEDPKFSFGALITDALVNVITKIVKSPFNALASLANGKEDLSAISFAAGKAELDEQQQDKLKTVAKALNDRPALDVEIKGAAFLKQDWPALTDDALLDQLKKRRAAEIDKEGSKKILAEYIELSDEQYKRLLADMFMEKYPLLADRSFFGTPRLKDSKAGDFYEVAKQKLTAGMQPEQKRLKDLASDRAQAIAKYLVQQGGIKNDRVFILDSAVDPKRENDDIVSTLSLKPR